MKQSKKLNRFTEFILILWLLSCGGHIILSVIQMGEESVTVTEGLFTLLTSVVAIFFIIKLLNASKIGFYGWLAIEILNPILVYTLYGDDYDKMFTAITVFCLQVSILFISLYFKRDGISGWNAIFKNEDKKNPLE